jgi:dTDP-4-dehydrorhamnose reductase
MRIAVTGRHGQIAHALGERGMLAGATIVTLARPEVDLLLPAAIPAALAAAHADIIVNAAAYTSVDLAETDTEAVNAVNVVGAAAVAAAARSLAVPVIHLSTDYVFDGLLNRPYVEDDATHPINCYGKSKLASESSVVAANPNHAILRTGWVYSPFGKNFLRTMLAAALHRSEVSVVSDQVGTPTSAVDIADGILRVAKNILSNPGNAKMRGIFHMTASGEATWAEFAEAIFLASRAAGGPSADVRRISTADYPTSAKRPANSRLNSARLAEVHEVILPHWREAVPACIRRLVPLEFSEDCSKHK